MSLRPQTTQGPPIELGVPEPEPQPVSGCARCLSLARVRDAAREGRDFATVSDANVLMRRHHD